MVDAPQRHGATGGWAGWSVRVFAVLFALLVLGFFFLPDQAGRNLLLYACALSAHAFALQAGGVRRAFGGAAGWAVPALVLAPALSLLWSAGSGADAVKDLLIAAYCVLLIHLGVATSLRQRPSLATQLATLMVLAGNLAGAAAIVGWAFTDTSGARMQGVWGIDNPVHASILLLASTLPLLWQSLLGQRSRAWLAALLVPLAFVVLAGARTAAAAYLLILLGLAAARRPRAMALVAVGAVIVAGLALALLGTDTLERVWVARGLSYRDVIWEQVWSAYRACNPLLGCGVGTPLALEFGGREGDRAHSVFMAALYHQGLLGLLVFVGALGWLLWRGWRAPAAAVRGWAWMLAYVLLANATSGDHVLVRASLFWPSFWIPVMVLASGTGTPHAARS